MVIVVLFAGALAAACSPSQPDLVPPAPTATPQLPSRTLTGEAIAVGSGTLLFVEPGRSLSVVLVDGSTRFENGAFSDVESMARANLDGFPIGATVSGLDVGPAGGFDRTWAWTVSAHSVPPAQPFLPEGPGRIQVGGTDVVSFRFVDHSRWSWIVTAWTEFDPAGDYRSIAALLAADEAGDEVWAEGEGAVIGQQLTLMRRLKAWRLN